MNGWSQTAWKRSLRFSRAEAMLSKISPPVPGAPSILSSDPFLNFNGLVGIAGAKQNQQTLPLRIWSKSEFVAPASPCVKEPCDMSYLLHLAIMRSLGATQSI
ncbi:unnamed protein product [Arctogadus glacialis]